MGKKFLAVVAASLLLMPNAGGAESAPIMNLDANDNSVVNVDELHDLVRRMVQPFDDDRDGALRTYEFHEMVFHLWDSDHDFSLSWDEFNRPHDWDSGLRPVDFPRLDGDGDEVLGFYEFEAFQERDMYETWDRNENRTIDTFEVAGGLVAIFDINGNGVLDPEELQNVPLTVPREAVS
ncbi:hypothetical protein [Devosia sp. RR2S18]|uniref:hypothetical protein n=1 Tax=Devosia rhizosphaerae TaxID=3049774 RepID=UPI002540602F|nr:hypothetical protein [Devosia sp. RR2S18]WIJ24969.1 hypothetical protein QOV41_18470 [Devosia sp. RR2S18]